MLPDLVQIRWKGIPPAGDTWEPERNLEGEATQLILHEFKAKRASDLEVILVQLFIFLVFTMHYEL